MIKRLLSAKLLDLAQHFPVVTVTGPRQSGKTTLVRAVFPHYHYISLENPDHRNFALEDPRGFLGQFEKPVILDEAQRAPDLFSYIQGIVDEDDVPGRYILTGSHNFLLLESITQSLAGRAAILYLLPFSLAELTGRSPLKINELGKPSDNAFSLPHPGLMEVLFSGFYPRIHDKNIPPTAWLAGYYQTYLERDVRNVLNIGDLEAFGRFVRLCAGRNGQLLNLSSLASDCGISHTTARRWLSVLEASFIITLLRPHHKNFGKRLIKSPKLYFLDSGLLCYLLRINSPKELFQHSLRGAIFESYVLAEFIKNFMNRGQEPGLFFWRDSTGHEIDILVDLGTQLIPVDVKSGQTVTGDFFKGLHYFRSFLEDPAAPAALVYGGDNSYVRKGIAVHPWYVL